MELDPGTLTCFPCVGGYYYVPLLSEFFLYFMGKFGLRKYYMNDKSVSDFFCTVGTIVQQTQKDW